ncbi:MAG TPA: hypothetical protein VKA83_09095 [Methylomirabilota bacterium]|nr:hypothetical protein [Methylomirabilota bacterium]
MTHEPLDPAADALVSEWRKNPTAPASPLGLDDLLRLYEDVDALLELALAPGEPARRLELAFGAAGKVAEITKVVDQLAKDHPALIDALERVAQDPQIPDLPQEP